MRIAVTGGTGFVGRHLARALTKEGHEVVLISRGKDRRDETVRSLEHSRFIPIGLENEDRLAEAFADCEAVAHLAGINMERGAQTYCAVHVEGTRHVVDAARRAGVRRITFLSFLKARSDCGSPYHESKWAAEEILRGSGLDYTVLKAGVIYGRGDHMLDHLSHALYTFPVFGLVGMREKAVRPTAVEDLVRILKACLVENRLSRQTVSVLGPEEIMLGEAVRRVASVLGKRPLYVRLPVWTHRLMAQVLERAMKIPLVAKAQVRILSEGAADPLPGSTRLPKDLQPGLFFTSEQIQRGLPEPKAFGLGDCRWEAIHRCRA